jgi:hypothetical protein
MTYLNGSTMWSSVKNRDKMKDDAIAQLSDQVMAPTARKQQIEKKHSFQ